MSAFVLQLRAAVSKRPWIHKPKEGSGRATLESEGVHCKLPSNGLNVHGSAEPIEAPRAGRRTWKVAFGELWGQSSPRWQLCWEFRGREKGAHGAFPAGTGADGSQG